MTLVKSAPKKSFGRKIILPSEKVLKQSVFWANLFLGALFTKVIGASKIKLKNVNNKRMATARRLIFFGIFQGIHC